MKSNLFEYNDYKDFLHDSLDSGERGMRRKLAEAMHSQVSYVSAVLNGNSQLSPEQALGAAEFLGLGDEEKDYFLNLLYFSRAGTAPLKNIYKKKIQEARLHQGRLKRRLKIDSELQREHRLKHYSSWQYGAVHVLLSIPRFRKREALAKKLGVDLKRIDEILGLLVNAGLAKRAGAEFQIGDRLIHLDRDADLIQKHHSNWRVRTLQELQNLGEDSLHYSAAVSLSEEDFFKVKEILSKAVTRSIGVVTKSEEEEAAVLCLDFYKL